MREIKFEYGFTNHAPLKITLKGLEFGFDFISGDLGQIKYRRQFTGLIDNKRTKEYPNGQEIYEGDIVKVKGTKRIGVYVTEIIFESPLFKLKRNDTYLYDYAAVALSKVIGNIYQNPELLK